MCVTAIKNNFILTTFLKMWRLLFVFGGAIPTVLIILINILLLWKVIASKKQLKTLVESVNLKTRKELKATILVLILSVFFLTGSLTNICTDLAIFSLESLPISVVKDKIQNIFNIVDISTIITFLLQSINIFIYYVKIKRFRVECNKILCINV